VGSTGCADPGYERWTLVIKADEFPEEVGWRLSQVWRCGSA
jgi:hypothetical protein